MVFVRFDCNTISVAASPATLVASIKDDISLRVGICANELLLSFGGKPLRDSLCLADYYIEAESTLHISRRLLGGKGGFGSLLRATSVKIGTKKTDDFGACRDLNGRRLRHVEAEKKLVDWYSKPHDTPEHEIAMAYSAIKKGTKMRKECRFGVNCKYKWKCKETHPDDNAHITRKQELTNLSRAFGEKNKPIPEALSTPEDMLDAVQMGLREDRLRRAEAKRIAEEKKRAEQDAISPPSTKRARITQPVWTCDSCSMAFYDSSAVRFRCVECDDYDCCASCYETVGKTHDHPMLQVSGEGAVDLEALQADEDDEDDVDTSLYSALASTPAPVHVPAAATTSPSAAIEPTAVSPPSVAEPSSSSSQPTQAAEEQAADKATQDAQDKPAALEKEYAAVNLADFESAEALLAAHTPDHLKAELTKRGLKCGGAPLERAKRLFLLKMHTLATIDKKHLAAPASQR